MKSAVQRYLPIVAVLAVVLVGRRLIPSSMGFLPRLVALLVLVVIALWLVSAAWRYAEARTATRRR